MTKQAVLNSSVVTVDGFEAFWILTVMSSFSWDPRLQLMPKLETGQFPRNLCLHSVPPYG